MAIGVENTQNVDTTDLVKYPNGNIKDKTAATAGTPLNKFVHADFHQFFAKLLRRAGITANNIPENETDGMQYIEALGLNQSLSYFSSSSSLTGNIGSWTKIYNLEFEFSNEPQMLSFDLYSIEGDGTRERSISVDLNFKTTSVPYIAFDKSRLGIQVTKSSKFSNNEIVIVLTNDSTTKKEFEIYVKYTNDFEKFRIITRTNVGKAMSQQEFQPIISSLPLGTQYNINEIYNSGSDVVDSLTQSFTGAVNIDDVVAFKKNGVTYVQGRLFIPQVSAMGVGETHNVTLTMKSDYIVNTSGLVGNQRVYFGAVSMVSGISGFGCGGTSAINTDTEKIRVEFRVYSTVLLNGAMGITFTATYPSI